LRGNLLPSNGPRARYQSSVALCSDVLYVFGGYVDSFTALNDSWYFSPKKETWDRVVCSKTPQAKGGAVLVADEKRERLILFGGKLSQLPTNSHNAFRTGNAALLIPP
jgi:N-acetylneuraminic acid mutarotase